MTVTDSSNEVEVKIEVIMDLINANLDDVLIGRKNNWYMCSLAAILLDNEVNLDKLVELFKKPCSEILEDYEISVKHYKWELKEAILETIAKDFPQYARASNCYREMASYFDTEEGKIEKHYWENKHTFFY
ncbi:hypothetical protein KKJ04_20150 [Xenorhabdus bovienii]|uniref:hypothetical protein n=1 Tax=Xenorhabdus bovienii TaxID=40576 RepID=UPI0023B215EA|nr:hypothetical protein [Xenorhabdus bovienii]MDE9447795.1 hypothetical protein [Xenorhabdus bovienii]